MKKYKDDRIKYQTVIRNKTILYTRNKELVDSLGDLPISLLCLKKETVILHHVIIN